MAEHHAAESAKDLNPYASPTVVQDALLPPTELFVDGNCIVVGSQADLPQRCIFTDEAVSPTDRRRRRLDWAPTFRLVLRHRHCYLSYCVNRRRRHRQYRSRILLGLVAVGVIWVVLGNQFIWVLPIVPIVLASLPMDAVRVVAYRDGRFWVTGFSDAFLRSCAQEYGSIEQRSAAQQR